jgi:hypothetical protein
MKNHPTSKRSWPNKHTLLAAMFLLLFIEGFWIFNYKNRNGVYKNTQDIWIDLALMTLYAVMAVFLTYKDHKIFIGDWKQK